MEHQKLLVAELSDLKYEIVRLKEQLVEIEITTIIKGKQQFSNHVVQNNDLFATLPTINQIPFVISVICIIIAGVYIYSCYTSAAAGQSSATNSEIDFNDSIFENLFPTIPKYAKICDVPIPRTEEK